MEVEEDASTWEHGDGGKKSKACERKETGYRGYLYRLTLPLLLSFSPSVQHKAHTRKYIKVYASITYVDIVYCCTTMAGWDLYCTDLKT